MTNESETPSLQAGKPPAPKILMIAALLLIEWLLENEVQKTTETVSAEDSEIKVTKSV